VSAREHDDDDEGLNIHVRSAIGGRIVRFRHYDRRADRNYHKVYIVPEDQDFERELGRMITLESMR
jgi:glutamate/tyrosine decarboxylase-like PLP-dependent enzyme